MNPSEIPKSSIRRKFLGGMGSWFLNINKIDENLFLSEGERLFFEPEYANLAFGNESVKNNKIFLNTVSRNLLNIGVQHEKELLQEQINETPLGKAIAAADIVLLEDPHKGTYFGDIAEDAENLLSVLLPMHIRRLADMGNACELRCDGPRTHLIRESDRPAAWRPTIDFGDTTARPRRQVRQGNSASQRTALLSRDTKGEAAEDCFTVGTQVVDWIAPEH